MMFLLLRDAGARHLPHPGAQPLAGRLEVTCCGYPAIVDKAIDVDFGVLGLIGPNGKDPISQGITNVVRSRDLDAIFI
jgi:hypothetical protein